MATNNLGPTLGALEIGTVLSSLLFGITIMQAYTYYSRFHDDPWQMKTLVITVCTLELLVFITFTDYFYTISIVQYAHPEAVFGILPASMSAGLCFSGTICCVVQSFFAERARRFSRKPYLAIVCWFLSFLRLLATIGTAVVTRQTTLVDYLDHWVWISIVTWAIGATVDILITVLLCHDLAKRRRDSFQDTSRLLDKLIMMTIPTGLITSLLSVAITICFLTMRESLVWATIYLCLARVFSISLLASLNARQGIRQLDKLHSIDFTRSTTAKTTPAITIEMSKVRRASLSHDSDNKPQSPRQGVNEADHV